MVIYTRYLCHYVFRKTPSSDKDISKFLNIKANRVLNSRGVIYLKKMLCDYEKRVTFSDVQNIENSYVYENSVDDVENIENVKVYEKPVNVKTVENADNNEKPART